MQTDDKNLRDENGIGADDKTGFDSQDNKLVRLLKSIVINPEEPGPIDTKIVSFRYYNTFNFSLLSKGEKGFNMSLGITSPKEGDGKTLVASNLAVSLAVGYQRKTVLIDLNFRKPRLHEVFGTPLSPGLAEAFKNGRIYISRTKIEHLFVIASGQYANNPYGWNSPDGSFSSHEAGKPSVDIEQMAAFRDIIYSLQQEFEFIIVDLPAIDFRSLPTLFANQLNGLLLVMHAGKTRREEIDRIFQHLHQHQILGFVLNRFKDSYSK